MTETSKDLSPATERTNPNGPPPGDLTLDHDMFASQEVAVEVPLSPAVRSSLPNEVAPGDFTLDQMSADTHAQGVEVDDAGAATDGAPSTPGPQPLHRQIFMGTRPGSPWSCYFCGGEIDELHVHHKDHDHGNNAPDNLAATHGDCHAHHHRSGLESFERPPKASALRIAAGALDDIEGLRKAVANQKRSLVAYNLLDTKAEKLIDFQLEHLRAMEGKATLALKHAIRAHPLGEWIKSTHGISEKGIGRLLAAIGEPDYNAAEDRPRRGPAELWAYCGYAPGQKRKRGTKSNWNAEAKMRAYICAETAMKVGGPYREVYDAAKANWSDKDTSDGHKHNHALRLAAKAILKDIFLQTKGMPNSIGCASGETP